MGKRGLPLILTQPRAGLEIKIFFLRKKQSVLVIDKMEVLLP